MNTLLLAQLDRQLASILTRVQALQQLDLAVETDSKAALAECRCLLGAMAFRMASVVLLISWSAGACRGQWRESRQEPQKAPYQGRPLLRCAA